MEIETSLAECFNPWSCDTGDLPCGEPQPWFCHHEVVVVIRIRAATSGPLTHIYGDAWESLLELLSLCPEYGFLSFLLC